MVRAYVKDASRAYPRLGVWATYYEKKPQDRIDYLSQLAWEHLSALPMSLKRWLGESGLGFCA